jgi:nuclear pore complex protein Nup155
MIQLDDERNLLYTVSKRNHIELYALGPDGTEFSKIASFRNLVDHLGRFNLFDEPIISIHPISVSESSFLHCVAINSSGCRLYFSTGSHPSQYGDTQRYVQPTTLSLHYVLHPAGSSLTNQNAKIHEAFYSNGITIAAQALEDLDRIMVFAPHAGTIIQSNQKAMSEYISYHSIEGRTWSIAEQTSQFLINSGKDRKTHGFALNELASQFEYAVRRFFILTNGGLTTFVKLRPIDMLLQIIHSCPPGEIRPYREFFYRY